MEVFLEKHDLKIRRAVCYLGELIGGVNIVYGFTTGNPVSIAIGTGIFLYSTHTIGTQESERNRRINSELEQKASKTLEK